MRPERWARARPLPARERGRSRTSRGITGREARAALCHVVAGLLLLLAPLSTACAQAPTPSPESPAAPADSADSEDPPGAVTAETPPASAGERLPVVEATLENGLRVLVLARPEIPIVSFVVRYGVGSVHEHLGITGIAHMLEHMLFKGTTTVGTRDVEPERRLFEEMDVVQDSLTRERSRTAPDSTRVARLEETFVALEDSARTFVVGNEFDRILSENGARNLNATTDVEGTTYYVQLPANRAKLWFVLEGDRMANPVFREFYTERDVVAEERRSRIDDSPGGRVYEEHLATIYRVHPYGVPVIGHMSDIQNLDRPRVRSYYERYYGGRNAVLAVVGDVEPDSILRWSRDYLERLPPGEEPGRITTREPEQRGERRTEVVYDAEPQLQMSWRVPEASHPDTPPLQILGSLLTGGRTSRLQQRLVQRERVAAFVSSGTGPGELYPRHFTIAATPRAPHTTGEIERMVEEELERLKSAPPDPSELERVRNQLEASRVRRLASGFGLAVQLAASESLHGDWRETFRFTDRLTEVTPDDVQRVARTYFSTERRSVTTLVRAEDRGGSAEPGRDP